MNTSAVWCFALETNYEMWELENQLTISLHWYIYIYTLSQIYSNYTPHIYLRRAVWTVDKASASWMIIVRLAHVVTHFLHIKNNKHFFPKPSHSPETRYVHYIMPPQFPNAIDRKTSTTLCKRKCGWWCVVVVVVAMPPSVFRDAIYISMLSATYSVYRCVRCGMWKSVWSGNHKRW